jgi:hypothetical protein
MWQRRTFHECASELEAISEDFRSAYTGKLQWEESRCQQIMIERSQRGVEILRILALSIRSEQDVGLTSRSSTQVGVILHDVDDEKISSVLKTYAPPYLALEASRRLGLRQALNCIAHANPSRSGFFADEQVHDIILSGSNQNRLWIAVFSLIDLCRVIKALPDQTISRQAPEA